MELAKHDKDTGPFDSLGNFAQEETQQLLEAMGKVFASYEEKTGRRLACNLSVLGDDRKKFVNAHYTRVKMTNCKCGEDHFTGFMTPNLDTCALLSIFEPPTDVGQHAEILKGQAHPLMDNVTQNLTYFGENIAAEDLDQEVIEIFSKAGPRFHADVTVAEYVKDHLPAIEGSLEDDEEDD